MTSLEIALALSLLYVLAFFFAVEFAEPKK